MPSEETGNIENLRRRRRETRRGGCPWGQEGSLRWRRRGGSSSEDEEEGELKRRPLRAVARLAPGLGLAS
jgi:hypothetical protein